MSTKYSWINTGFNAENWESFANSKSQGIFKIQKDDMNDLDIGDDGVYMLTVSDVGSKVGQLNDFVSLALAMIGIEKDCRDRADGEINSLAEFITNMLTQDNVVTYDEYIGVLSPNMDIVKPFIDMFCIKESKAG